MKISLHKAAGSSLHLPAAILFGMTSYEGEEKGEKEEGKRHSNPACQAAHITLLEKDLSQPQWNCLEIRQTQSKFDQSAKQAPNKVAGSRRRRCSNKRSCGYAA